MKTPITDDAALLFYDAYAMADVARRLERDRAALMEAVADYANPFVCRQMTHEKLLATLAAARANFPTE
jgi:hypothetical protein